MKTMYLKKKYIVVMKIVQYKSTFIKIITIDLHIPLNYEKNFTATAHHSEN